MKILIATESYYPNISGVAIFSHNLAKKMVDFGHQVFVIAPSPKLKQYEEIYQGVKIYRIPSRRNNFRKDHYTAKIPFKNVKKIIENVQPDVVHLQDPMLISFAVMRNAKRLQIPIVITNHFSLEYVISYLPLLKPLHPFIAYILTQYLNWFYAKANILTCPTKTIADYFIKNGIKIKINIISNGVDISKFMPKYGDTNLIKNQFNIPKKIPLILYVGRLDIDKSVDVLINAVAKVCEDNQAHFVIVGDGKEKENLIKLSKDLKISKNITFINFIPYNDLKLVRIYQSASIFVNPCPMETQSIVVLEAEATGLPCVVADSGALVELVKNGINGYRFKSGDSEELARKIIQILLDKKMAIKMGDESLKMIEEHIVEDTYKRFEKIYQKLS